MLRTSVNSVCHTFGRRKFETNDQSKNQWLVGLLAFGKGWHNNHHAFPRSALHGMRWWQFDLSAYIIRLLEWASLASNFCRIPEENMQARLARTQAWRYGAARRSRRGALGLTGS